MLCSPLRIFGSRPISRAFYEHLNALGAASPDGYDLIRPVENGQKPKNHELFFGTKVKILDITGPCVINAANQNTLTKISCPEGLILKENGEIEIRKDDSSEQLDGTNKIFIVPTKTHARTLYYDKDSKKWKFFDNQSSLQGKCGLSVEDAQNSLNYTQNVQIISLPK